MMRFIQSAGAPLCAVVAVVAMTFTGGCSETNNPMTVTCRAEGAKTRTPAGLCPMFMDRLAQAYPGRAVVLSSAASAAVTLVVTDAAQGRFMARIDQGPATGPVRGMARKDAPLNDAALARFLDGLIAETSGLDG